MLFDDTTIWLVLTKYCQNRLEIVLKKKISNIHKHKIKINTSNYDRRKRSHKVVFESYQIKIIRQIIVLNNVLTSGTYKRRVCSGDVSNTNHRRAVIELREIHWGTQNNNNNNNNRTGEKREYNTFRRVNISPLCVHNI